MISLQGADKRRKPKKGRRREKIPRIPTPSLGGPKIAFEFLILNQSPYPRFEVPRIDFQGPNDDYQSLKLDSQTHKIDF